ncbi:MAG: rRNA maturation RNase YbeY [Candidatus Aphodosoma sp.]
MITYYAESVPMPKIKKRDTNAWIKEVAAGYGKKVGEIAYIFCNDEKILDVNREFLNHDYYTDIITFDYSENNTISGDIFISLDTVRSNAKEFGTKYLEELHRVLIHGILHLCGQDDKSEEDHLQMVRCEDKALSMIVSKLYS